MKDSFVHQRAGQFPIFPSRTRNFSVVISQTWPLWRREGSFLTIFLQEEKERVCKRTIQPSEISFHLPSYACRAHHLMPRTCAPKPTGGSLLLVGGGPSHFPFPPPRRSLSLFHCPSPDSLGSHTATFHRKIRGHIATLPSRHRHWT